MGIRQYSLIFPIIIVFPDNSAILDSGQREDRSKGRGDGLNKLPLLIIYARARRALRRTNSHHDQCGVCTFVHLHRSAIGQRDAFVCTVLINNLRMTS